MPTCSNVTVQSSNQAEALARELAQAGCLAANEEAEELLSRAAGDPTVLRSLVERRMTGEPLAWITGSTTFCGHKIETHHGVYVPRWQSEELARRATERLPASGTAIDICTGAGAIALTLAEALPDARVVATELDERAVACAIRNGVEVFQGDLFAPVPEGFKGNVDVIVGVVPYVPTGDLALLPRDTFAFESPLSYDGGGDGTELLRRAVAGSPSFLRRRGALLLELGGSQADLLSGELEAYGYRDVALLIDEDGDTRGIEATFEGD